MRRHNPKEINLKVDSVEFIESGIIIRWCSNIGFGEYIITCEDGKLEGYSECMDSNDDKEFLETLLEETGKYIVENIKITG